MLSIYFDEIKYTRMEESPQMELVDLVANIGGTLGLFIGVSFLSFAEALEFVFIMIGTIFNRLFFTNPNRRESKSNKIKAQVSDN